MDQFDRDVLLFELFVQVADEGFLVVQGNRVGKNGIIDGTIRLGIYQAKFEFRADGLKSKRQYQKSETNIHAWGYAKLRFRPGINDAVASHLEENVKAALSREVLTINRIRKFARKARDYKLTYSYLVALADGEDASAAKGRIEHLTKLFKQHCSALNTDYKFIATA